MPTKDTSIWIILENVLSNTKKILEELEFIKSKSLVKVPDESKTQNYASNSTIKVEDV